MRTKVIGSNALPLAGRATRRPDQKRWQCVVKLQAVNAAEICGCGDSGARDDQQAGQSPTATRERIQAVKAPLRGGRKGGSKVGSGSDCSVKCNDTRLSMAGTNAPIKAVSGKNWR